MRGARRSDESAVESERKEQLRRRKPSFWLNMVRNLSVWELGPAGQGAQNDRATQRDGLTPGTVSSRAIWRWKGASVVRAHGTA